MAKSTKLGACFTPRNFPANPDWADAAVKIAEIGGHASLFTNWPENTPLANLQIIKDLCTAQGLGLTLTLDPLTWNRDAPSIPVGLGNSFSDPTVRAAYVARVLELASLLPRTLGLATEVNLLKTANPSEYAALVTLTQEAYTAVKQAHPLLDVSIGFQWDVMITGTDPHRFEAIGYYQPDGTYAPGDFAQSLNVYVFTSYPGPLGMARATDIPGYYTSVRTILPSARIAFSELGYPSGSPWTETAQANFYASVPAAINPAQAEFVTLALFHDLNTPGGIEVDTVGVRYGDGRKKKSWSTVNALVLT